jgi:hypothetical protein
MMGDDLRTVQELMGDKDIRITCRDAHRAPGTQARGGGEARGVEQRKSYWRQNWRRPKIGAARRSAQS